MLSQLDLTVTSHHRGAELVESTKTTTKGSTTIANVQEMTVDEAVSYFLEREGVDYPRESLT